MSTKIYNGYRLEGIKTLEELQEFCTRTRKKIEEEVQKCYAKDVAEVWENIITIQDLTKSKRKFLKTIADLYNDGDKIPETWYPYMVAYDGVRNFFEKAKNSQKIDRYTRYDYTCDVVFIAIPNKILALIFTEKNEIREVWDNLPEVKEYHYQNQTDKPDEISEEEWEQRKEDWDIALPGDGVPNECGLVVEFVSDYLPFVRADIEELPTFEERVRKVAKNAVWMKQYRGKGLKGILLKSHMGIEIFKRYNKIVKKLTGGIGHTIGLLEYIDAGNWLNTDMGKKEIQKQYGKYEKILRKEITRDDIFEKFQDYYNKRGVKKLWLKSSGIVKKLLERLKSLKPKK